MKEIISVYDFAGQITKALPQGILLNTNGEKFNSMIIGWGALGRTWNYPTFTVFVRENRYTKSQIDKTGEFSISIPLAGPIPEITRICGSLSGRNIDKVREAHLTLEEPQIIRTPGIREYPLTLECKVLYTQEQVLSRISAPILGKYYPQDLDGTNPMANRDPHTAYIAEIVDAYIIR